METREIDEEIFMCWCCGLIHFESSCCPKCNASAYHQCTSDKGGRSLQTPRLYAQALRGGAKRLECRAERFKKLADEYDKLKCPCCDGISGEDIYYDQNCKGCVDRMSYDEQKKRETFGMT